MFFEAVTVWLLGFFLIPSNFCCASSKCRPFITSSVNLSPTNSCFVGLVRRTFQWISCSMELGVEELSMTMKFECFPCIPVEKINLRNHSYSKFHTIFQTSSNFAICIYICMYIYIYMLTTNLNVRQDVLQLPARCKHQNATSK